MYDRCDPWFVSEDRCPDRARLGWLAMREGAALLAHGDEKIGPQEKHA
jgi:hypothetical protein